MTVRHPALALSLALLLAASWLLLGAQPASAGCHVAGFVEESVSGDETVGEAVLIVELRGRIGSCEGTVDVTTVDGSATGGSDYEPVTRTLTFETDDDRIETLDLLLFDDAESEGDETFTVVLSNPTGGISGTGDPATVTIVDNDVADAPGDGDETEPTPAEATAGAATEAPASEDAPAPDASTAAPTDSGAETVEAVTTEAGSERSNTLLIIVVGMVVIAGVAFFARNGRAG